MNSKYFTIAAFGILLIAAAALSGVVDYHAAVGGSGFVGAMAVVQSSYATRMTRGIAGMVADMNNFKAESRICETAAGIGFGLVVGRGSGDMGAVLGAGAAGQFLGITVRDTTLIGATADKYAQYDTMSVLTEGDIWCAPGSAVNDGDDVTYVATTGVLSSAATSGSQFAITGARWLDSSSTLARVRLGDYGHSA